MQDQETEDIGLEIVKIAYKIASERKALQPMVLHVADLSGLCSYIFIASMRMKAQVRGLSVEIDKELIQLGYKKRAIEGQSNGHWVLIDYSDAMLNVMLQEERDYYQLEQIWRRAAEIEL